MEASISQPARSRAREIARQAYVYGIYLLFASIIVQFFLAGRGALEPLTRLARKNEASERGW